MATATDPKTAYRDQPPARGAEPAPPSELAALRAQVEEMRTLLAQTRDVGGVKLSKPAPVYARAPWDEEIIVEALQDCIYPDPTLLGGVEYGLYRRGRQEGVDDVGNPTMKPGNVFRLKHREHLNPKCMRVLTAGEVEKIQQPVRHVPQTTNRSFTPLRPLP